MTADVAVIGAGIVGAACAAAFRSEGLQVILIDHAVPAGGATAAGMGHIVVIDEPPAELALSYYSRRLWDELDLPPEVECERRGTLWIAADEEEFALVRRKKALGDAAGIDAHVLDAAALAEAEPNLRPGLRGALLIPGDLLIYAPCAARWLARGIPLIPRRCTSVQPRHVHLDDGSRIDAGVIVVAAGTFGADLALNIPVRPRKGHLAITDRYPGFVRHALVELAYIKSAHGNAAESVACNIQPRKTGQVLIGSSRQFGVSSAAIDFPILQRMLQRSIQYMPALAELNVIRTWTGFRAATPDGLPLIGPHPAMPGVYLATGHEGLGITTSLGTARLLADLVLQRPTAIPIEPYLPSRCM